MNKVDIQNVLRILLFRLESCVFKPVKSVKAIRIIPFIDDLNELSNLCNERFCFYLCSYSYDKIMVSAVLEGNKFITFYLEKDSLIVEYITELPISDDSNYNDFFKYVE